MIVNLLDLDKKGAEVMKATIKDGDKVLLHNIEVSLSEGIKSGSVLRTWSGSFTLPIGKDIHMGMYRLYLEDGRAGNILVNRVLTSGNARFGQWPTPVGFQGSGTLE
jgi:hypothetical protein